MSTEVILIALKLAVLLGIVRPGNDNGVHVKARTRRRRAVS